jgi:hypothetical protein
MRKDKMAHFGIQEKYMCNLNVFHFSGSENARVRWSQRSFGVFWIISGRYSDGGELWPAG